MFYFCTVCGLSLYEILVEKLSLGNTSYPILEPQFVPGLFLHVFSLTSDFDKPCPWPRTLERVASNPNSRDATPWPRARRWTRMDADVLQRWTRMRGLVNADRSTSNVLRKDAHAVSGPVFASVYRLGTRFRGREHGDGRRCAAAMDSHAWASERGQKHKQCLHVLWVGTGLRIRLSQTKPVVRKCIREAKRWSQMCGSDGPTCMGCSEQTEAQTLCCEWIRGLIVAFTLHGQNASPS